MSEIAELIKKRAVLKARLTRFHTSLTNISETSEIGIVQFKSQYDQIKSVFTTFDDIQSNIEYLDENNLDEQLTERESFESKYAVCMSMAEQILNKKQIQFLRKRADLLETLAHDNTGKQKNPIYKESTSVVAKPQVVSVAVTPSPNSNARKSCSTKACEYCHGQHPLYFCEKFQQLPVNERIKFVDGIATLCKNCLRSGHVIRECSSRGCKVCNLKHNTSCHTDPIDTKPAAASTAQTVLSNVISKGIGQVLLPTAVIRVTSEKETIFARALLDSGSQCSLVTRSLCQKLKLCPRVVTNTIVGINGKAQTTNEYSTINIESRTIRFSASLSCIVLTDIVKSLPNQLIETKHVIPKNIELADETYFIPSSIDILIRADLFWVLIGTEKIALGDCNLYLIDTKLGRIDAGPTINFKESIINSNLLTCSLSDELESLTRFWELEEIPNSHNGFTVEENECERHFTTTTCRMADGRFLVKIPLRNDPEVLGESFGIAQRRFLALERRLESNYVMKQMYIDFMREYRDLGHMTEVPLERDLSERTTSVYTPHHGVLRESSATTKLRVVFNCSAKTSSGLSFNDIQMVGPRVQDDLINMLFRFRFYKIVITADVEKMYRQVIIHESQRKLQKILFRDSPQEHIKIYELNTVTYGTASAPYLATRCIKQLAMECEDPKVAEVLHHDFYIDDLVTGANTFAECIEIGKRVKSELISAGFNLRKWRSNNQKALENIVDKDSSTSDNFEFCTDNTSKILGLGWCSLTDELFFPFEFSEAPLTKRQMLSQIARIFDPLGLLSPIVIQAKAIIQKIWLLRMDWDAPVPDDIKVLWDKFTQAKNNVIPKIKIPRKVICDFDSPITLHVFCDASQLAYGACAYVKTVDRCGNSHVKLLCAKSRVAPLKTLTIPRLELCGAVIAARLYHKIITSLRVNISECVFWTDSTVVLDWLKIHPNQLRVFVGNRVAEIIELTKGSFWRHVPTKENPADLITRGASTNMSNSEIWWNGPSFLIKDESCWPQHISTRSTEDDSVEVVLPVVRNEGDIVSQYDFPFERFSNFNRLKRTVAYLFRFYDNCRNPQDRRVTVFTTADLDRAYFSLIRLSQQQSFPVEYELLYSNQPLLPRHSLLKLNPFIDHDGLMRVGGRLDNSDLVYEEKHPIILQSTHKFTKLLFEYEHLRMMHAGPQLLLGSIRERFWPLGGRNLARSIVHKCLRCYRFRARPVVPLMGQLPRNRVVASFPFETTGINYAGPIHIASKKGRGSKLIKAYVGVFVCFTTRAIHLEAVSDLSSEAFLLAFRRFISRRGKPNHVFSDNGSNFVGAYNELKKFLQNRQTADIFTEAMASEGIQFHFGPPYAPHFGGLYEASVKSMKYHLKRVIGHSHLTFEELATLLTEIESILNSRPLSPLSSDPNDYNPLTPGHFLIGRPLTSLPSRSFHEIKIDRLTRYERIEALRQHFWRRWHKEHLHQLQQRPKWHQSYGKLRKNQLVLIKQDNLPPLAWKLGRIVQVYPGKDGIVRVADVQTRQGLVRRAACRICPLPEDSNIEE